MDLSSSDDEGSTSSKDNQAKIVPPLSPIKNPQSTKRQAQSSSSCQPADEDNQTSPPAAETNASPSARSLMEFIQGKEHEDDKEILLKLCTITFDLEGKDEWWKALNEVEIIEETAPP